MKINIKTLSAVGALLLCSQNVAAATIEVFNHGTESRIIVKGEIRKGEKLSLPNDPFTVVRNITFANNKLKEFTPEIENWLKKQGGVTSFGIQMNEFKKFPTKILEWFPHLRSIHFWENPIKSDSPELLYYGNLRVIEGCSDAFACSRKGVNMVREGEIKRYNEKINDVNNRISEREKEISSLQDQIKALKEQKLDLRKSKRSNRQKNFLRKDINKSTKDLIRKLSQSEEEKANLQEKKEDFEGILGKLDKAQKKSEELEKRENPYYRNL